MLHHVVVFSWQPGVEQGEVDRLTEDLRSLAAEVDGLTSYACGSDLNLSGDSDDFAVAASFVDEGALTAYLEHPSHRRIVEQNLPRMVAGKHKAQFATAPPEER